MALGLFALTLVAVGLCVNMASACDVPVFRYALERWEADRYEAIVFHNGPPDDALREQITILDTSDAEGSPANLDVNLVDLEGPLEPVPAELWATHGSKNADGSAWLIVRGPRVAGVRTVIWSGRLDRYDPRRIVSSPAREELVNRLLSGDSAVWLVLAGEDNAAANDACKLLSTELERLGDDLPLPDGLGLPGSEVYSPIPLTLRFSVLRVNADDPRERWLVDSLRAAAQFTEEDGPLVVPVFGRGRALEVIPAGEVNTGLAEDISRFVCGACSCQVKEQNPGVDLLLAVDWDRKLFEEDSSPSPAAPFESERSGEPMLAAVPLGVIDDFAGKGAAAESPPAEGTAPTGLPTTRAARPWRSDSSAVAANNGTLIGGALAVVLLIAGLFVLLSRLGSAGR